jgi:hypothetical protein
MDTNDPTEADVVKKRGFWLSAFLILMFIVNPFIAFTYICKPEVITQAIPELTSGILYFGAAMAVVNVILAAGIWTWKKWGVLGFYGAVAIAFCTNLYVGLGITGSTPGSLAGSIGAVLIFFTAEKRWEHFS